MKSTKFDKVTRSYEQRIFAPAEKVFPLLCPVRETEWLEDFESELIYSESGVAEEGCVFRTQAPGGPETIWIIVRHDQDQGRVEFVRVTQGLAATRLNIQLTPAANRTTDVNIMYTFNPISDDGAAFIDSTQSADAFRQNLEWWERSMNHYIETGKMLRKSDIAIT